MKKEDNDMFPQDNVVDGASRPKVRKKSSNLSDNSSNITEYGSDNENRDVSSTNDTNVSTTDSNDIINTINSSETAKSDDAKGNDSESSDDTSIPDNSRDEYSETSDEDDNCDLNDCYYDNLSSSCNIDLAVLNEISVACQTAMNNISYLVKSIYNSDMKKELVAMYSQYSNVLFQVNQHFEKYGEVPDCVSIGCKVMGFCGIKMNTLKNKSSSHIAEIMIQGTLMGVLKCQKILNCQLNIDESTTNLLKDFNKFQRDNIDKLNAYL